MGTYIGKVQIGNDSANLIALGDTLYGTCDTAAATATKVVTVPNLDRVMNGIQIRVRFASGNTVESNVQLSISGTQINNYIVLGDCTCSENDIVTFTWELGTSVSYWRVTGNTLTKTIKDYISSIASGAISGIDSMVFKGTIGVAGGTVSTLPTSGYTSGWTYKAITDDPTNNFGLSTTVGSGQGPVEAGDLIIAIANAGTNLSTFLLSHWTVVQSNLDGTVTGPATATDAHIAIYDGATGKIIKDSGFTIGTSVPANAVFTDNDTTYTLNTTNVSPYTSSAAMTSDSDGSGTVLVSIVDGVLHLANGIKFTTSTAVATATLTPDANT